MPAAATPSQTRAEGRVAPPDAVPGLWHYTCDHAVWQIVATGALVPRQHPLIPGMAPVCWLTSDPHADREALGLTSDFISCDRMTHLFKVTDTSSCARWSLLRLGACSGVLHPGVLDALERFADPELWWLSTLPVPVERVP